MVKITAEDWLVRIDNALEYRRKFACEDKWADLEKSYLNDSSGDTAVGPNLIYSQGDAIMSALNVPDPECVITAEHPMGVDRAPIVEYIDNWLIRKLKIKRTVDLATLHCYLKSKGIIKIGYDSEFGWSPRFDIGTRERPVGATLTQFDKKGKRTEFMNTVPGMPWIGVVQPEDFVVPWGTIFLDDAPWAAHRIVRKNTYFKSDPKYKNTSRLEPQLSMEDYMASYTKTKKGRMQYTTDKMMFANRQPEYNVAWEIHDRMSGKVFVVSPDYDKFLREDDDALLVAGLPFVDMSFVSHPRSFWATPQAYYLGQIQHTQFDISMQAEKTRRINNLKFLAKKGVIDPQEMTRLLSGDVGVFGFINSSENIKDLIATFPQGSMMDFIIQSDQTRKDAREVVGFGRNQMGEEMQSTRRTAREATFVQQGSERRTGRRFSSLTNMYIELLTKLNKICFSFWKTPRYAMVGNDWVKFNASELKGDYLYDMSLSTTRNLSRAERKIEAMMMMSQLMMVPGIDHAALFKYLQDAANDPAFERILAPVIGKAGQAGGQGSLPTIPSSGAGR